jgi:hypothetical protein
MTEPTKADQIVNALAKRPSTYDDGASKAAPKRAANNERHKSAIYLDKIRTVRYALLLTESPPPSAPAGADEEGLRLFDNPPDHNPRASLKPSRIFLFESAVTH